MVRVLCLRRFVHEHQLVDWRSEFYAVIWDEGEVLTPKSFLLPLKGHLCTAACSLAK